MLFTPDAAAKGHHYKNISRTIKKKSKELHSPSSLGSERGLTRSKSNFSNNLSAMADKISNRFDSVFEKQQKDLERAQRKLAMKQE